MSRPWCTKTEALCLEIVERLESDTINVSLFEDNKTFIYYDITKKKGLEFTKENLITFIENYIKDIIDGNNTELAKRWWVKLSPVCGITEEELFPKKQLDISKYPFNVIGCPTSTDIDIVFLVDKHIVREFIQDAYEINIDGLKTVLSKLGYDITRDLDINIISVNDRADVSDTYKGGKEVQNIIYYTWKYHNQRDECFFNSPIQNLSQFDKLVGISKFLLDHLDHFVGKDCYQDYYREVNKQIYKCPSFDRIEFTTRFFDDGYWIIRNDDPQHIERIKSLVMKFIQLILLERNEVCYTKKELAQKLGECFNDVNLENAALYYLTRGKDGSDKYLEECITLLFSEYKRICNKVYQFYENLETQVNQIDVSENPTVHSDIMWEEFIKSPTKPTPTFKIEFDKIYRGSIGSLFEIPCFGGEFLPESLKDRTHMIPQRCEEWKRLLKFYKCGNNSGIVPYDESTHITDFYYNLIRGCMIELFIINKLDFSAILGFHVNKASVGMVVEKKGREGCIGVSPDTLLVDDQGNIIPVEIKTNYGDYQETSDLINSMELAKMQISTICKLAGADRGLIIYITITKNEEYYCHYAFYEILI